MKLSIIIPAYNEEHRLPMTLEQYASFFSDRFGHDVEIIVVANHCSDHTEAVTRTAMERWPLIRIIVEPARIGKGGAVKLGMRRANGELIGFVDADGAAPPEAFHKLTENLGGEGCVIGSRWVEGAVVNPPQSWVRRAASRVLNRFVVHGMFGLQVSDSQCGAKLFRKDVLDRVLPESREPGWAFDIDLLCRIERLGYSIVEVPVEWHHVSGNPTTFIVMCFEMLASVRRVKAALAR